MSVDKNLIISLLSNDDKSKANADLSLIGNVLLQKLQEKREEFVMPRTTKKYKFQVPSGQNVCVQLVHY